MAFPGKQKPVKTITGNDPNLAKALAAQMAQQRMQGGAEPTLDETIDTARQGWMKNQMAKAAAHADRLLDTDEELPLSRHIIMLSICVFFIFFFLFV